MEKGSKDVAARLRGLRDAMGFSREDMAEKTGASPENVKAYESGDAEIPVSYLMDVAHACGVDLTVLITGGESRLHDYCKVEAGRGLTVDRRKDYAYRNLAYTFTGRKMEPFLITVPPKKEPELTFTTHAGQEFIYVLKGRLEVTLQENKVVLEPGDSLYFSSNTPHALRGLDGKNAEFLDVII
ncbi:MAG: helix-turn-helix domain-containing protein [Desulfovibrionaceae bacterium]